MFYIHNKDIMETRFYWVSDNKFIFKSNFNSDIDIYIGIISKYNSLIFANYNNLEILLKYDNKYSVKSDKFYVGSNFNKCITLPDNLTSVTFGCSFNQLINLPPELTHLTFGFKFNQHINLPPNLTHLTFGYHFNQPLNLPNYITHLTFGHYFNHPLNLPLNLTHLTFGDEFNQLLNLPNIKYLSINDNFQNIVDNLPNSLEELCLASYFNSPLYNLPSGLKKLVFDNYTEYDEVYDHELNLLSNSLEYLALPNTYDKKILNFPPNLHLIKCSKNYVYKVELQKKNIFEIIYS